MPFPHAFPQHQFQSIRPLVTMKLRYLLLGLIVLVGCTNESDPEADKANFTRIYDNSTYNAALTPIDIKQTPDGGFLILSERRLDESNFSGIYLLKTDEFGGFVTDVTFDPDLVNPVADLMELDGQYYFFCMTAASVQTQLVQVSPEGEVTQTTNVGGSYPTAATPSDGNFLLLGYDNEAKQSVVSIVTPTGTTTKSQGFSIGAGDAVEEPIINHFIRTGRRYPFQIGKLSSGLYFFNGFYNYTFSLLFTDLSDDTPNGIVQGQQDDGGISQLLELPSASFAAARFNFGDNYFLPKQSLSVDAITSSSDLGGFTLPELVPDAPIRIISATLQDKDILIYGSNTQSRQIGLFFYDPASGEFKGSRYLGFSNPYELARIIPAADGGLAVCGTTYVAGRFPRICLFKLSAESLKESL